MCKKGKIITFVGLDGSGKSTQAGMLRDLLDREGRSASLIMMKEFERLKNRELLEFLHKYGLRIRDGVEMEIVRSALAMRKRAKNELLPLTEKGETVITDRYLETAFVFARQLGVSSDILTLACEDVMGLPDHQFFIDVPPEVCSERIHLRNREIKPHETDENLRIAYRFYREQVEKGVYIPVNGLGDICSVHMEILEKLNMAQCGGKVV